MPLWQPASDIFFNFIFFKCLCYIVCVLRRINTVSESVTNISGRLRDENVLGIPEELDSAGAVERQLFGLV